MVKESVSQFLTSVKLMLRMEIVLLATRDMISKKDNVFSLNSIMLDPQIWDVVLGIGITKFALLAPKIGSSTQTEFAYQLLINARLMLRMEIAHLVIKDMT